MSAADLNAAVGSTHELLLRLLAGEMGLLPPQHPQAQFEALHVAYPELKRLALAQLEHDISVPMPASPSAPPALVSGRDDGLAFAELFRGVELFVGPDTLVDDYAVKAVMTEWVLPLTGRKVEALPEVRECVLLALQRHHSEHSLAVRKRNLSSLKSLFRFSDGFLVQLA